MGGEGEGEDKGGVFWFVSEIYLQTLLGDYAYDNDNDNDNVFILHNHN